MQSLPLNIEITKNRVKSNWEELESVCLQEFKQSLQNFVVCYMKQLNIVQVLVYVIFL